MNQANYLKQYTENGDAAESSGGLAKTLAFLNSKGIEAAVLDQTPEFPANTGLCILRAMYYGRDSEPCVRQPASRCLSWQADLESYFSVLKKQYKFSIARPAAAFCDGEECRVRSGEVLFLMDSNHLTEAGAMHVMPYLNISMLSGPLNADEATAGQGAPAL
jgi:hypothetical protein